MSCLTRFIRRFLSRGKDATVAIRKTEPVTNPAKNDDEKGASFLDICPVCKGHGGWGGMSGPFIYCPRCSGNLADSPPDQVLPERRIDTDAQLSKLLSENAELIKKFLDFHASPEGSALRQRTIQMKSGTRYDDKETKSDEAGNAS